jgi:hypothetical protein
MKLEERGSKAMAMMISVPDMICVENIYITLLYLYN